MAALKAAVDRRSTKWVFTGKHMCWSLFLIKFRHVTLLKSNVNTGVFLKYCGIF